MLSNVLRFPHPMSFGWVNILIPVVLVFFILTVLAPYGFVNLSYYDRVIRALPFIIITSLSVPLSFYGTKFMFPQILDESKWNIGKEILYQIYDMILIGFWSSLYLSVFVFRDDSFFDTFIRIGLRIVLIGILPVATLIMYKNGRLLKAQLSNAIKINEELNNNLNVVSDDDPISFYAQNGKFEIKLSPQKINFFKSEGNYVDIFYIDDSGNEEVHLIRNRLKTLYETLPKVDFYKVHKSYVVNINNIAKAEGNAKGLKLFLSKSSQVIPVSRSNSHQLLELLKL